jgi:MFS family permease
MRPEQDVFPAAAPTSTARRPIDALGIFAVVLGNGFEFFDFTVYAAYIGIIGRVFYPSDNPFVSDLASAATFGVGFIARPLGGILIGAYGDRAGRKPAMMLTIGLMALSSALIAFLPGYATIGVLAPIILVLARLAQGFAVGGEMGPATMFMLESAPRGRRTFYGSWQIASQNLSSIVVGVTGFVLAALLSEQSLNGWGWRLPFMLGIFIAPVGMYIRSRLGETLEHDVGAARAKVGAIISTVLRQNWCGVLLGVGLICGGTITQYFLLNMTPYAIRTLHLPASTAMLGTISLGVVGAICALVGGRLGDLYGVKKIAIIPRLMLLIVLLPTMQFLVAYPSAVNLVLAIAILMALHAASSSVGIVLIALIFPNAVRSAGLAVTYALGVTIFGGTATYIVTWLVGVTGNPLASVYYVFAANLVGLASLLAISEYSPSKLPTASVAIGNA